MVPTALHGANSKHQPGTRYFCTTAVRADARAAAVSGLLRVYLAWVCCSSIHMIHATRAVSGAADRMRGIQFHTSEAASPSQKATGTAHLTQPGSASAMKQCLQQYCQYCYR